MFFDHEFVTLACITGVGSVPVAVLSQAGKQNTSGHKITEQIFEVIFLREIWGCT